MSEVVWEADAGAPTTRREARERLAEQEAGAATSRRRGHRRRAARTVAGRRTVRPSVLPTRSRQKLGGRILLTRLMSFSAMMGVAGILVATSLPANAFLGGDTHEAAPLQQSPVQADIGVQSIDIKDGAAAATTSARDNYTVLSLSEQMRGKYNTTALSFINNPNGTIQWPFPTGVPISSGYGSRVACAYCSSNHLGVDFVPGLGTPIQAIADGVVREVDPGGGPFGTNIVIDHEINGQKITSRYAHMLWGSPSVAVGQAVAVGQYLGDVGNTGNSTGPHLHLEIQADGASVDPFAWLKANAN